MRMAFAAGHARAGRCLARPGAGLTAVAGKTDRNIAEYLGAAVPERDVATLPAGPGRLDYADGGRHIGVQGECHGDPLVHRRSGLRPETIPPNWGRP